MQLEGCAAGRPPLPCREFELERAKQEVVRSRQLELPNASDLLLGALIGALAFWVEPGSVKSAVLVLLGMFALLWRRSGGAGTERDRTRLIVLLAMASLVLAGGRQTATFVTTQKVRVWNVYHYYLGAKYFEELGYTDLYDATLRADREGRDYWRDIDRVRDLITYEVVDRDKTEIAFDPSDSFSPERWRDFRQDVEALSGQRSPARWKGIFRDRGFNASPVWVVVGSTLANLAPTDRPLALKFLCSLDLPLLVATFWLLLHVFGLRQASLVLLLLTSSPVNANRFVGGFLQYDWFCAVALAVCFYRMHKPKLAAFLMAYAVLTRVFPLLFVLAGLLPILWKWWTTRRPPLRERHFLVAFLGWCALLLALSLFNGRGVGGWREFVANITTHKQHHVFGERRVGLQFLFTHKLGSFDTDESVREREKTFEDQHGFYLAGAAAMMVVFLIVARKQTPWDAQILGLVPVFALLVTSRYYWSYLALIPLVGWRRGPPLNNARRLGAGQLALFATFYLYDALGGGTYSTYVVFNISLAAYLLFVLVEKAFARPATSRAATGSS